MTDSEDLTRREPVHFVEEGVTASCGAIPAPDYRTSDMGLTSCLACQRALLRPDLHGPGRPRKARPARPLKERMEEAGVSPPILAPPNPIKAMKLQLEYLEDQAAQFRRAIAILEEAQEGD